MIATAKRPPTATLVPNAAIEQATLALQNLPEKPKEEWSMREAVDHMRASIVAALGKGYNYDEVAVMLSERGVQISPSSLKYYLTRVKKNDKPFTRSRTATRAPRRSRKTEETTTVEVAPAPLEPKVEAPVEKASPATKPSGSRTKTAAKTAPVAPAQTTSTKTGRSTRSTTETKAKSTAKTPQPSSKTGSTTTKKPGTRRKKMA